MIFLDSLPYKLGTAFEEINIDLELRKNYDDKYSIYISDRYSEVYLFGKVFESICSLFFSNNILTTIDYRFNNKYYTLFKESINEYLPTDKKLNQDPFLEKAQLYSYYENTAISLIELNEDFFLLRLSDNPSLPRIKPNN